MHWQQRMVLPNTVSENLWNDDLVISTISVHQVPYSIYCQHCLLTTSIILLSGCWTVFKWECSYSRLVHCRTHSSGRSVGYVKVTKPWKCTHLECAALNLSLTWHLTFFYLQLQKSQQSVCQWKAGLWRFH